MTVTGHVLAFAGSTGKSARGGKREYTANYIVTTNDKEDDASVILNYFRDTTSLPSPERNSAYSYANGSDPKALCDSLEPTRDDSGPYTWRVAAHFGDAQDTKKGEDKDGNPTDNPLEFALDITTRFNKVRRPIYKAEYIEGFVAEADAAALGWGGPGDFTHAVVNSAMVVYDPPLERDAVTSILSVTGNFAGIYDATEAEKFINVVNASFYTLTYGAFFFSAGAHESKVQNITPSLQRTNGLLYWRVNFEIETDRELGWRYKIIDRGTVRRAGPGDPDGKGGTISASDIQPGAATNAAIVDSLGFPVSEPVLLNGNGQPLENPLTDDPVVVTWRYYQEKEYTNIPLLGELIL